MTDEKLIAKIKAGNPDNELEPFLLRDLTVDEWIQLRPMIEAGVVQLPLLSKARCGIVST